MLEALRRWYRGSPETPYVRPWGLSAPIAVLIVCLPLLRPLWEDPTQQSDNERARLATVAAIVERKSLAIDGAQLRNIRERICLPDGNPDKSAHRSYSAQPPVLAACLAIPYWLLHRLGFTFEHNYAVTTYLLTLLGSTLPVAVAAGIVYRLGRLFELHRLWRALLAFASVFGSGLISYATVINAHAPAAALMLAACGSFYHAAIARNRGEGHSWLALAGFAAALAAVIDLGSLAFMVLLILVILAMRWSPTARVGGILWYLLGALPPLALHAALTVPITGDLLPGFLHPELRPITAVADPPPAPPDAEDEEAPAGPTAMERALLRLLDGTLGPHGLLSHFPLVLLGIGGIGVVLHRHWPFATKMLAVVTLASALIVALAYAILGADWDQPMFATRWYVPFLPMIVFWTGAWLRQGHHPAAWTAAGLLLGFSVLVSMLGATAPFVRARHGEHTAYAAARQIYTAARTAPLINK